MGSVGRLRELLHRRYLRAVVATLAFAAAGGGIATAVLELRYGVPARAVVRYFSRLHDTSDDLAPLLRAPRSLAALAELGYATSGMNVGGLVYSVDGRLEFHPWMPPASAAVDVAAREHEATYVRLLAKYLAAETDGLIAELWRPQTRRQLGHLGVAPSAVEALRRRAASTPQPDGSRALLRQAGRLILPFMPSGGSSHELELGDKLRFYADHAPDGRYLGLYEVRGPSWLGGRAAATPPTSGRLLVVTKEAEGRMAIDDLQPHRRRRYLLTPVPHPAGLRLYRVTVRT